MLPNNIRNNFNSFATMIDPKYPRPLSPDEIAFYYKIHPELWASPEAYRRAYPDLADHHDPGFFQKAASFGKAIVEHAGAGFPTTGREMIDHRWAICRACEHFDPDYVRCRVCGCRLNIKIDWAEQRCPIGKW